MPAQRTKEDLLEELVVLLLQELRPLRARLAELEREGQEHRRAEENLRAENARLREEQRLHDQRKHEAIARLAGGVAHHFNNQLVVVLGQADLLAAALEPGGLPHHGAEAIRQAGERMAALVRQLLAFTRQQALVPRVLDLNACLTRLGPELRRLLGPGVRLTSAPGTGPCRARVDPAGFEQVILALAANARDAMPRGGELTVRTGTLDAKEGGNPAPPDLAPGPYAWVAVSDTGHGMDGPTRARLFEPFFTTRGVGGGAGLALAAAHGFVRQSGGHIEAQSEPGRGTTFRIYLPRTEEPAGAATQLCGGGSPPA